MRDRKRTKSRISRYKHSFHIHINRREFAKAKEHTNRISVKRNTTRLYMSIHCALLLTTGKCQIAKNKVIETIMEKYFFLFPSLSLSLSLSFTRENILREDPLSGERSSEAENNADGNGHLSACSQTQCAIFTTAEGKRCYGFLGIETAERWTFEKFLSR